MPTLAKVANSEPAQSGQASESTRKFFRDVFFSNLPVPFGKIRTYLWIVFFSRSLGADGFGIWSLFLNTLGVALPFTSMMQGNAMMRFLGGNRSREEINRGFSSVLAAVSISSVIVSLILVVSSSRLSDLLFKDRRGTTVLLLTALLMPLETCFELMRGLLRARRLNRSWAFFTLGRQIPETFLLILLVLFWSGNVIAVVGGYVATAAVSVLIASFYLVRYQQVRLAKPSMTVLKKLLPYGFGMVPGAFAAGLSFSADRYLVSYYLGLNQVGIYTVCFTISAVGFFFVGPINDVLLPEMAALYDSEDRDQFYKRFSGVQKFVVAISMGATALLVAFPHQILLVFSTREFASGGPTLAVLGMQGIFMSIVWLYVIVLCVRLHVWWNTGVWTAVGIMILIVDIVLLPRVGVIGAGVSQLVSSIAGAALIVGLNWQIFRRTFQWIWLAKTGTIVLGLWCLARLWSGSAVSIHNSIAQIAAGAVIFVLGLFATRYLRVSELLALRRELARP